MAPNHAIAWLRPVQFSNLLEADLFGYEKGAFTGADKPKAGLLETVKDGTVFFDEFHHLGLTAQSKLLRLFQDKVIRRVSGIKEQLTHFRLVVGTQPKIIQLVEDGIILDDIYDRINQLQIFVPPLRERKEDIEPLVAHFTAKTCKEFELSDKSFRMKTVRQLLNYDWPGNVRELENLVTKLVINCTGKYVELTDLPPNFFSENKAMSWNELEGKHFEERKNYLVKAIQNANGIKARAATALKISPNTLHSLTVAHDLYLPTSSAQMDEGVVS